MAIPAHEVPTQRSRKRIYLTIGTVILGLVALSAYAIWQLTPKEVQIMDWIRFSSPDGFKTITFKISAARANEDVEEKLKLNRETIETIQH